MGKEWSMLLDWAPRKEKVNFPVLSKVGRMYCKIQRKNIFGTVSNLENDFATQVEQDLHC